MSIYYTRINNSAFNRAQTVINHSYNPINGVHFPKYKEYSDHNNGVKWTLRSVESVSMRVLIASLW